MAYVSVVRIVVKPGAGAEVERLIDQGLAIRRDWQRQGDLLATWIVGTADRSEYVLVSTWASREAHDRHEDAPEEDAVLRQLAGHLAAPPTETSGDLIAEL
jgi:quinol monooxygenase YgiN